MVIYLCGDRHPPCQDHSSPLLIDHEEIRKYRSDHAGVEIGRIDPARMMHQAVEAKATNANKQSHHHSDQQDTCIQKPARRGAVLVRFDFVLQFVSYPQLCARSATRSDGDRKTYSLYEPR